VTVSLDYAAKYKVFRLNNGDRKQERGSEQTSFADRDFCRAAALNPVGSSRRAGKWGGRPVGVCFRVPPSPTQVNIVTGTLCA
jgi:hypothetical protein